MCSLWFNCGLGCVYFAGCGAVAGQYYIVSVPKPSAFLVVLSQHVNLNCVIGPDNHVIEYQFASSISGLPVRACACRAALPLCHMIVSNPAI